MDAGPGWDHGPVPSGTKANHMDASQSSQTAAPHARDTERVDAGPGGDRRSAPPGTKGNHMDARQSSQTRLPLTPGTRGEWTPGREGIVDPRLQRRKRTVWTQVNRHKNGRSSRQVTQGERTPDRRNIRTGEHKDASQSSQSRPLLSPGDTGRENPGQGRGSENRHFQRRGT